jgi:cytochrome P450
MFTNIFGSPTTDTKFSPYLGMWHLLKNTERFLLDLGSRGPIVPCYILGPFGTMYVVTAPELVMKVLEDTATYGPIELAMERLQELLGRNIVTTEGAEWKAHRLAIEPAVKREHLKNSEAVMRTVIEEHFALRRAQARNSGIVVDIMQEMSDITIRVLAHCLLSDQVTEEEIQAIKEATVDGLEALFPRLSNPFVLPAWVPTSVNRRVARARKTLQTISERLIKLYDEDRQTFNLIVSLLNSGLPPSAIDANVRSMFIAGHETTSVSLGWSAYLLATKPDYQDRLTDAAFVNAVSRESLRLYPPAWLMGRSVKKDCQLGGFTLHSGTIVYIPILSIHRNPHLWGDDALEFKPERWQNPVISKGRWLPFGGGPRVCAGAAFALKEMQLVLTIVGELGGRFRLVNPEQIPQPVAGFTRKPGKPLMMRIEFVG